MAEREPRIATDARKRGLRGIASELCRPLPDAVRGEARRDAQLPDANAVIDAVRDLVRIVTPSLFPSDERCDADALHAELLPVLEELATHVDRALAFAPAAGAGSARAIIDGVADQLPWLRDRLLEDVGAAYRGDPACTHPLEPMLSFPGVYAITHQRIAHLFYQAGVPLLPRIIAEHAHSATGIDIHPGARIGHAFFVDHGTGVVIGETCVIGDRVTLYQGVTLGARSFPLGDDGQPVKGIPRHPIVEDDVTIYASATILGRVTIGRGSVIGGNVWLTQSLPPGSRVFQAAPRDENFEQGGGI